MHEQPFSFVEDLKRQWMAMIDAVRDPLVILNCDFTILRQNRAYTELSTQPHLPITDFQGLKCYEVFAGRSSPCPGCKLLDQELIKKQPDEIEWQNTDDIAKGKTYIVRVHQLRSAEEGNRFVVHYRDVTEFVALQENLAHAEKLAALGKLAGGVAHEINSPLAGILAFTQMLLKETDEGSPQIEDLKEIEDAARKCKVIVENMLGFARQDQTQEKGLFNLLDSLESTLRLAKALLRRSGVALHYERPENEQDFIYLGQSGKIGQVFLNLITNSIQAMPEGGTLRIDLEATEDTLRIDIADTGNGMDQDVLKKAFDPFFTTKPYGQGTGLGLSISYSIVKAHGGVIKARSQPGHGTLMQIELPRPQSATLKEAT